MFRSVEGSHVGGLRGRQVVRALRKIREREASCVVCGDRALAARVHAAQRHARVPYRLLRSIIARRVLGLRLAIRRRLLRVVPGDERTGPGRLGKFNARNRLGRAAGFRRLARKIQRALLAVAERDVRRDARQQIEEPRILPLARELLAERDDEVLAGRQRAKRVRARLARSPEPDATRVEAVVHPRSVVSGEDDDRRRVVGDAILAAHGTAQIRRQICEGDDDAGEIALAQVDRRLRDVDAADRRGLERPA